MPDAFDSTKVEDQVRFLAEILKAGVAQLAAHRTRNAARVSSTLTAGSGDQRSEIRSQRSEVRDQKSEIRSQKSELERRNNAVELLVILACVFRFLAPLIPDVRNPSRNN